MTSLKQFREKASEAEQDMLAEQVDTTKSYLFSHLGVHRRATLEKAVAMIPDGASLMIGGFMGVGTPEPLMDELVRQGKRGLTVIANAPNPAGYALLKDCFAEKSISALGLFSAALLPTLVAVAVFWLIP